VEGWDLIKRFNPATILCMISTVICHGLFRVLWFEVSGDCSFCWHYCWQSLFKLSFHNICCSYMRADWEISRFVSQCWFCSLTSFQQWIISLFIDKAMSVTKVNKLGQPNNKDSIFLRIPLSEVPLNPIFFSLTDTCRCNDNNWQHEWLVTIIICLYIIFLFLLL
jgi:hypothetical protein